jgi:hypothetical protein
MQKAQSKPKAKAHFCVHFAVWQKGRPRASEGTHYDLVAGVRTTLILAEQDLVDSSCGVQRYTGLRQLDKLLVKRVLKRCFNHDLCSRGQRVEAPLGLDPVLHLVLMKQVAFRVSCVHLPNGFRSRSGPLCRVVRGSSPTQPFECSRIFLFEGPLALLWASSRLRSRAFEIVARLEDAQQLPFGLLPKIS